MMLIVKIICPPREGKTEKEEKTVEVNGLYYVHNFKKCPICNQKGCNFLVITRKKGIEE